MIVSSKFHLPYIYGSRAEKWWWSYYRPPKLRTVIIVYTCTCVCERDSIAKGGGACSAECIDGSII